MSSKSRKRKTVSLGMKIEILDRLGQGIGPAAVGREFELGESTIRGIKSNENNIRSIVSAGASITLSKSSHARDPLIKKMEKMLIIWVEDKNQKNMPLSGMCIRAKAKQIYYYLTTMEAVVPTNELTSDEEQLINEVVVEESTDEAIVDRPKKSKVEFSASKGWLENFKKRFALHNICLSGEAASADTEAAKLYPAELKTIIEDGGYVDAQIFNADETGLFWKKMPNRTYISKAEKKAPGFKAAKDRLTLLFCGNKSGDLCTKPLLIYRSLNPRALKNVDKNKMPVFWRANRKAWMTEALFKEWFFQMFIPEVEAYMKKKNLSFKVLLLVDNATCHPEINHPNVKVIFIPPNTTALIQPMDQGYIAAFKSIFLRLTFEYLLNKMDDDVNLTVIELWKNYSMVTCLEFIEKALQELKLKPSTLAGCWKKICPVENETTDNIIDSSEELKRVVALSHALGGEGFSDMAETEIQELINDDVELTEEDLSDLVDECTDEEFLDEEFLQSLTNQGFTSEILSEAMECASRLKNIFLENDSNVERSGKFQRELNNIMAPYVELRKEIDHSLRIEVEEFGSPVQSKLQNQTIQLAD